MKYTNGTIRLLAGIITAAIFCMACEKENGSIIPLPDIDPPASQSDKIIAIVEQSQNQVALVNATTGETVWQWTAADSDLTPEEQAWLNLPDEVKPIYNCEYLLITATRGGVAIIRIADKRVMFYACPKGNPHSAEVLPDGNIVVATSTDGTADGDKLRLYEVDFQKRYASKPVATYPLLFGHNVVWDRANQRLWATADNVLNAYTYVQSEGKPALVLQNTYPLPEGQSGAHDLFPVYGLNQLWLTTLGAIYKFNVESKTFQRFNTSTGKNIKSVSSGPAGYPTIILYPTVSYWSDKLIDTGGRSVYQKDGYQIYKGRWVLKNTFSYPEDHPAPQI